MPLHHQSTLRAMKTLLHARRSLDASQGDFWCGMGRRLLLRCPSVSRDCEESVSLAANQVRFATSRSLVGEQCLQIRSRAILASFSVPAPYLFSPFGRRHLVYFCEGFLRLSTFRGHALASHSSRGMFPVPAHSSRRYLSPCLYSESRPQASFSAGSRSVGGFR